MTVEELYHVAGTFMVVIDFYRNKFLCRYFKPEQYPDIAKMQVKRVRGGVETIPKSYDIGWHSFVYVYACEPENKELDAIAREVDEIFA